ncbi:hypothetical protein MCUN1_003227 [Malassezia cuniculi]|uniref:Uncharacterized protein n=1 Tax=Malassezia cuniculi TaxID=948313 RepID=A0AAF0ESQ6_9BASI|nr:hypothetical protein MCUN1_003227 [Malassezia cuniculi]
MSTASDASGLRNRFAGEDANDKGIEGETVVDTTPKPPPKPPIHPKPSYPVFVTVIIDSFWNLYAELFGITGFAVMEPWEIIIVSTLYILVLIGTVLAIKNSPTYVRLALRRLHYYIYGE